MPCHGATWPGLLYDNNEALGECKLDYDAPKEQIQTLKKATVVEKKKHNTEADDLGNDKWSKKDRASNNQNVELDMEVDALNPDYMYPDLSMPWNGCYLKQKDPTLHDWWTGMYHDLPADFKPNEAHIYNEDELVALAKKSPASKIKAR